jgi:hypothetical protein
MAVWWQLLYGGEVGVTRAAQWWCHHLGLVLLILDSMCHDLGSLMHAACSDVHAPQSVLAGFLAATW